MDVRLSKRDAWYNAWLGWVSFFWSITCFLGWGLGTWGINLFMGGIHTFMEVVGALPIMLFFSWIVWLLHGWIQEIIQENRRTIPLPKKPIINPKQHTNSITVWETLDDS